MNIHFRNLACLCVWGVQIAVAVPAFAEEAIPPVATEMARENLPEGPLSEVGQKLRDAGLEVDVQYVNLYANTPDFGFVGGEWLNAGFLIFDTTYRVSDSWKLKWRQTINVADHSADTYLFSVGSSFYATYPYVDTRTDLTRLTVQGDFLDGRLELEAGRMNIWPEFFRSEYCGGLGCTAQVRALVLNAPGNSASQWGARIGYNLSPHLSLGAVLTEDNAENWRTGSGWDWEKGESDGYSAVLHLAQREGFREADKPLNFEIGAYRRSADYVDALYDAGWGNPTFGPDQIVIGHDGGSNGVFAQGRQVVWSRPDGTPFPENVAVYGGAFHTFGDGQAYPWEAFAGIEYEGFWRANPVASVGATVHYIGLSQERAAYETNARRFLTGTTDAQPRDSYQFDVHSRLGVGAGFLELGAAYVIDPNAPLAADYLTSRMKDGWTFYVGLVFDIGAALSLSRPKFP